MHGRSGIKKTLYNQQRALSKTPNTGNTYIKIGSWRFQENEDGDLIVINTETQKTVKLIKK